VFYNILSEDGRVTNFRSLVKAYISYTSFQWKTLYDMPWHFTCHLYLKISKIVIAVQKYVKCTSVTHLSMTFNLVR